MRRGAKAKAPAAAGQLRGWRAISEYLGQPVSTLHRWAQDGMPVQRSGRYTVAAPDALDRWLRQQTRSTDPVQFHHAAKQDLVADLRRGLRLIRGGRR